MDEGWDVDRSQVLFRRSEAEAVAGLGLVSVETVPEENRAPTIIALAFESPERFVELVSHLSPLIQDIFFQYYLLGRTYAQIGAVLFPKKTSNAAQFLVKT